MKGSIECGMQETVASMRSEINSDITKELHGIRGSLEISNKP